MHKKSIIVFFIVCACDLGAFLPMPVSYYPPTLTTALNDNRNTRALQRRGLLPVLSQVHAAGWEGTAEGKTAASEPEFPSLQH